MKVLFVSAEVHPFLKTGGLADVAYALPKSLCQQGLDVRVIMPKYSDIPQDFAGKMSLVASFNVYVGWRSQYCGLYSLVYEGVTYYFIDNEYYFKRGGCYGYYDDGERFAYFCRAVLESIFRMDDFRPDVIHCNDWHTGMIPVMFRDSYYRSPELTNTKTVFTIHNLKYQGLFSPAILEDLCGLTMHYYTEDKLKYNDAISFMKGGIVFADRVTTVSDTYAKEIQTPEFGEGLDGLLREKSYKLSGITNGIDYDICNPQTDPDIAVNYTSRSIKRKVENKTDLQATVNLPVNPDVPVIGLISRLVRQKGIDLITCVIEELLKEDVQLVLLGSGDRDYQDFFEYYASSYPGKVACYIGFDGALASKIYAGSDIFLMPSHFEPCGISQMISMRYGTIPVVRETGGLKDTVTPFNEYTDEGNGFSFANYNAHEMLDIIRYALKQYKNKDVWQNIIKNAMKTNSDWKSKALEYIKLYEEM
ncbi:MAG: glycogen synthase GlgA [Ruminococcaceae bacterium]|nr:glycogen synthase GlgA [Oscillospiraceae bacterium]